MKAIKAFGRKIFDQVELHGINLYRKRDTTRLTPRDRVINLLNRIWPHENGYELIRIGGPGDGGYLVPDDLAGISECFSPGSNKLSNFESEIAQQWQIKSFICDSVDEKPSNLTSLQDFTEGWVGPATDELMYVSLSDWVKTKSKSDSDLMLQMDIEGSEYLTLLATPSDLLNRFRIIVIELHFLEALKNNWAFEKIYLPFFDKILQVFDVVHVHPNNCCGTWSYGNFEYPRIVELTLHRKDRGNNLHPKVTSRNVLDYPCVGSKQDFFLVFSESQNQVTVKWE